MTTTDTTQKLAQPTVRAKQIAEETQFAEIVTGTEKQIKFANDLRNEFMKSVISIENDSPVRWAVIKQTERGERLSDLDVQWLATDAWNRRTINAINTSDSKKIIDWFVSLDGQRRKIDTISRYEHIIRYPAKWQFDNKKGWVRISYK